MLAILLLWPAGLSAQNKAARKAPARKTETPAPPANRWPIQSVLIEGLHNYKQEQVLPILGLKRGQVAGKPEFEAARDRLAATGAFETVSYRFGPGADGSSYTASFQVTEVTPVYPVRFQELSVPDKDVIAWLQSRDPLFGPKIASTQPVLDRYAKLIQEYLTSKSVGEKVIGQVSPVGTDQFVIVFRPARRAPAVAQVNFTGNQAIGAGALQNAISEVAVGTAFTEDHFRQLLDNAVRPHYERLGRLRVSFPKITAQPATDVQGLNVLVEVNEGPVYKLGSVRVEGLVTVKPDELIKIGAFKSGDLANFDEIGQGVERVKKRLRHQGYMRVDIQPERHVLDERKLVDLTLHINQGPQFVMGNLKIEGLDIYAEPQIRKAWALGYGKPFDADLPEAFLARLRDEGVFENLKKTRSKIDVNEQNHSVDVTLYFE